MPLDGEPWLSIVNGRLEVSRAEQEHTHLGKTEGTERKRADCFGQLHRIPDQIQRERNT